VFLKSAANAARFFFASAVLLLAIPQAGLSQIITDEAIDTLDEIVVYGAPTLRLMRDEVYEAEENFYELFNALNKGRQFDVKCFYRSPFGSQIRRRVCEAYFVNSSPTAGFVGGNGPPHWAYVRHKTRQMRKEMATLVDKHPKLNAALLEFVNAKQSFDSSFRNRCGNRLSICRK
jgi:hypothetical protein